MVAIEPETFCDNWNGIIKSKSITSGQKLSLSALRIVITTHKGIYKGSKLRYLTAKVHQSYRTDLFWVLEDLPDAVVGATQIIVIVFIHLDLVLVFQGPLHIIFLFGVKLKELGQ